MDINRAPTFTSSAQDGHWMPNTWTGSWTTIIFGILALSVATRLFSGILDHSQQNIDGDDGPKGVPRIPYWLPILGHVPNLIFTMVSFMNWARSTYKGGAFALNLGGTSHNFIFHPGLGTTVLNDRSGSADSDALFQRIVYTVFGFPRSELNKYDSALHDISACYKYLLSEPSLGNMVQKTVDVLKANIADFVTFAQSPVDQSLWERTSNADTIEVNGERVVEANLLPLARDFVTFAANPSLIGTDFMHNNPSFFSDLYAMDKGFFYLATGLPRWFPFPPLTAAHLARSRMFRALRAFETAMEASRNGQDPGSEWRNLEDVNPLIKERQEIYEKHGFSIEARASIELSLLWAMNANANPLIFWLLNHIYADKDLLEKLREEVKPYVRAVQPKQEFGIPEPPRLESIDQDGLVANCPLLKSSYIETLRVDTSIYSLKYMEKDFVLAGRDKSADKYLLKKGTYTHVAHDLHHKDPAYFDDPETWRADRHVVYVEDREGEKWVSVNMGTVRPFGGGQSMCKGRAFAQKEVMVFAASIISFWDIEAVGGGPWKMPRHKSAVGTYTTSVDSTRVWIKRRALPQD
ncbi:hypothetical protein AAFC00_002951 [Neodothiora populina]|uniref:Cytochrome P450 n=1 Tax=Neodothiora populina TaxID=2781224 RepID=A0ABR3P935_9PEZI